METREVKMYSDYKSPFAYLAFDPAYELQQRYRIRIRWIPFQLRLKGPGQRSIFSEYKAKYSYLDARRWAQPRGIVIRGPKKIYDTTPALIGRYGAGFRDTTFSFRRLSEAERRALKPYRIAIVRAGADDTVESLAARLPFPDHREERLRVLNGLEPAQKLEPGQSVKLLVEP